MHHLVAPCDEQLCDQPPVAAPPHGLGAEEAGSRFLKRRGERLLPLGPAHPRRVTPEGRRPDAAESLFTRLAAAAPPEDAGRSDTVVESSPPAPDTRGEGMADDERRLAREESEEAQKRGRLVAFLVAVWAELQRVQWPDRRQVGQGTAVTLGFVVIAGLYLGVADYAAQEVVDFIL